MHTKVINCANSVLALLLLSVPSLACTTAIVGPLASESGKPMIWKQRDTDNPFNVVAHIPRSGDNFAYTAVFNASDTLRRNVYGGQNEKGFAIVNNASYNLSRSSYDASNGKFMRKALESCKSVDEFEEMLRSWKDRDCEANFAVLDSFGAVAYIEAADSSVTRYDAPADGYLVRSNYSFSGTPDGTSGYARYESAAYLMSHHKGKFSPHDLIDGLGRSYYNAVLGYDASRKGRYAYDEDFIPRQSTTSSLCIDGQVMWVAIGYTPASFAVPVRVSDGFALPSCITAGEDGKAPANVLADSLKKAVHPLPRDAAQKYIDFDLVKPLLKLVRRYEALAAKSSSAEQIDALFKEFQYSIAARADLCALKTKN